MFANSQLLSGSQDNKLTALVKKNDDEGILPVPEIYAAGIDKEAVTEHVVTRYK